MVQEIMKNVYRIPVTLPNNPLKELNSYYFKGKDRCLLIDTGFRQPEGLAALKAGLKELGADMTKTDILLTHLHSDHTGNAPEVASPESRVFLDKEDSKWLAQSTRWDWEKDEDQMFREAGISEEMLETVTSTHPGRRLSPDPKFERYEHLEDGQIIEVAGYKLQIIKTPGHTPGNTCIWLEEQKTMFSADHVLFDITPNIQKWTNMENALGHYLDSLRKVRKYPVETCFPAHRKTGDFHARIDELLEHHTFRLNECLKVIQENPGLCAYDITGKMTWRIKARNWDEFPTAQKWFAVGECLAHLDYLMNENEIIREMNNGVWRYYPRLA